jgi:DNA-binding beta-propeller fold protein YncE/mono/diheme cytochrome c family protein
MALQVRRSRGPLTHAGWNSLLAGIAVFGALSLLAFQTTTHRNLSSTTFSKLVLAAVLPESPFHLRFFPTPVKTDSRGRIISGPSNDPVKNFVGAEAAGERAGLPRFTKILFGAQYDTGRPGESDRIDPNNQIVKSGGQHWPHVPQPFRSWPTALALTADGSKLYVTLPGREGYPDWRVAVMNTSTRQVNWIDLRPPGQSRGTRPMGITISPVNTDIAPSPFAVVLNHYANFASVIDTATDSVIGEFETGFYGEKAVFNSTGTRLYITDRFKDEVHAFRVEPGPVFTQIAEIPTGNTELDRTNPRDLALSADGNTLYVANTLGHTIAVINVAADANTLVKVMPVGGLATDVKVAGRWGIVSGHETNSVLNQPETGHGLPKLVNGVAIKNDGKPLGYTPVMSDATRATTFDDIGSELNVFDTATNLFVFRYVDFERDLSMLAEPGKIVDLGDHQAAQKIIKGSGPEQIFVRGDLLFVSQLHSDKVEVFRINQNPSTPAGILAEVGFEFTGGITPQGVAVSPDGKTVFVANMQTEDVSILGVDTSGRLTRQGFVPVGVTDKTPDPTKGGHGAGLFATHEEVGLRWLFTQSYSDDGQKSCGFCHWQSRHDGNQWNVGANAVGGPKAVPQNKDLSDNWPQWFEGLSNNMTGYASSCNGELIVAERITARFPQADLTARLQARDAFVRQKTAENSAAINRPELKGDAASIGYYEMAFAQILWTQNETRRMPNPLTQFPSADDAARIARGKQLFTSEVAQGGAGCASCHHNGNVVTNGEVDDTFQDFNIYEPGVASETTVGNEGPFLRLANDYFFEKFGPPQDIGGRQNISSRNTKHLRAFWDSVPRWLHHGDAHTIREILLPPDSPLLRPGERGFNFRTVRTDSTRRVAGDFLGGPPVVLATEVPITFADSSGSLAGDGKGPILVSIDAPTLFAAPNVAYPDGRLLVDQLGTSNVVPLITQNAAGQRQINPQLAAHGIAVITNTHGKTGQLSADEIEAITRYLESLQ